MNYKVVEIDITSEPAVELRFLIAGIRADGEELVRFDIPRADTKKEQSRRMNAIIKTLKAMKEERLIQLYAAERHFETSSTEAEYLLNKYPTVFLCGLTDNESADFIYVKV